jgi:hypothetical protein
VVYHTTLLVALVCPLVAYLLSAAGLTFITIELPSTTYERLELVAVPAPRDNRPDDELRTDFLEHTAAERIAETAALSRTLTGIASGR